jgi:acylphosphatase
MIPGIIPRVSLAADNEGAARLHAVVSGFVQGVSFRYYTQMKANELGVVGWVRNRPDGSVEVTAEGPHPALLRLEAFLRVGPPSAQVARLDSAWLDPSGEFTGFAVRY